MSIKNRIDEFIAVQGIKRSVFEKSCGFSNGYTRNLKENPSASKIEDILNAYPELNRVWLLSGDGEMLKESVSDNVELDPIVETKAGRDKAHMIPFYDAETTGGFQGRVSSSTEEVTLKGYINAGDWFDGRETAAIRHCGDSMLEYPNGCVLAVREVREFRLLVPGRNYVIETDEYRVTKRVQKGSEKGCIALYSTNQEKYVDGRLIYEPFEVFFEDIRRIFAVLGYIVNQSGEAQLVRP